MKNLLVLLALGMTTNLMASERLLLEDSKNIETEVSQKTVFCSRVGYGFEELKINIEALNGWTILDHSNTRFGDREGLPCMTAGPCATSQINGLGIDDIVQDNPRLEKIQINRKIFENKEITETEGRKHCERSIREELKTVIGGVEFTHSRSSIPETLPVKACR